MIRFACWDQNHLLKLSAASWKRAQWLMGMTIIIQGSFPRPFSPLYLILSYSTLAHSHPRSISILRSEFKCTPHIMWQHRDWLCFVFILLNRDSIKVGVSEPGKTYVWKEQGYTSCSASCLGGVEELIINCVREDTGKQVENRFILAIA